MSPNKKTLVSSQMLFLEDQVKRLEAENDAFREECSALKIKLAEWVNFWRDKDNKALRAENARLREELEATKCGSPDSRFGECVRRSYAARAEMGESDG